MIIRKKFEVESAHIVRNCTSDRCSHSIHGHSAKIEVFLESRTLDNAGMVYDFGLMKNEIKSFIDSMDHCYLLWDKDDLEFGKYIQSNCKRWILLPFNPSAEQLSMFVFKGVSDILKRTHMANGEGDVKVKKVIYHETATGYAECDQTDVNCLWNPEWDNRIIYSSGVTDEWTDEFTSYMCGKEIQNPEIEQQVI